MKKNSKKKIDIDSVWGIEMDADDYAASEAIKAAAIVTDPARYAGREGNRKKKGNEDENEHVLGIVW